MVDIESGEELTIPEGTSRKVYEVMGGTHTVVCTHHALFSPELIGYVAKQLEASGVCEEPNK